MTKFELCVVTKDASSDFITVLGCRSKGHEGADSSGYVSLTETLYMFTLCRCHVRILLFLYLYIQYNEFVTYPKFVIHLFALL